MLASRLPDATRRVPGNTEAPGLLPTNAACPSQSPARPATCTIVWAELLHYGAFADQPRSRRSALKSATDDLINGDSHDYASNTSTFNSEHVDHLPLGLAEHALVDCQEMIERWQGAYSARGPEPNTIMQADLRITAVVMHTGLDISIRLVFGERTIESPLVS